MHPDVTDQPPSSFNERHQLTNRERKIVFSPLGLVLTLAFSVFFIEFFVMILLYILPGMPAPIEFLLDSTILTLVLSPILYFYLFKPLLHLIKEHRQNEAELQESKINLEGKILERTAELDLTVSLLQNENDARAKVESALRDSEMRFRQIFEQSEDAIILISAEDHSFLDANPPAERLFGKGRDELITSGLAGLELPLDDNRLSEAITNIVADKLLSNIERLEYRTPDNDTRILSFRGKMIKLQETETVLATFRDITRRVRMEEDARNLQSRLIHANRMTSLGLLVSSVAHEINNPANYILSNSGLIKKAWLDIEPILEEHFQSAGDFPIGQTTWNNARTFLPDAFDGIQDGARRIGEIVENLKGYGREDQSLREGKVEINEVVRISASILGHHISRLTSKFSTELDEGLPSITGNKRQLEQVVTNLIQNALQALPNRECAVRVSTHFDKTDQEVIVRVTDNGSGISTELADHIMEPFFTTRLEQGGTGLGLAICSTIVKDHGGRLEFSSEPGIGTTFAVHLPVSRDSSNSNHTEMEENHDDIV
ncbi:MAG: PAS domain S-box protein [Geobacter sp.]|nr:PAS domain S-box protein [Geobacter sp.]